MIVKIMLSISILLSSSQVLNIDNPSVYEFCPEVGCDELRS